MRTVCHESAPWAQSLKPRLRAGLVLAMLLGGCARTGLWADGLDDVAIDEEDARAPAPERPDAVVVAPSTSAPAAVCRPAEETCNGVDDDCDGMIDEVPSIPCPGGGAQYCVAGRWSVCPSRCEVCLPGSERICFNSYCTFWGVQTCTGDGQGFGPCREYAPPAACRDIAKEMKNSVELERCCIDHGYCCIDEHDIDGDGDREESMGRCEEVSCHP